MTKADTKAVKEVIAAAAAMAARQRIATAAAAAAADPLHPLQPQEPGYQVVAEAGTDSPMPDSEAPALGKGHRGRGS